MENFQVATRRAPLRGWLIKRKRDTAPSRLLRSSNRRFFTIDFDSQVFYYAHSEHDKTVSLPFPFQSIRGVVGTGPVCLEEDESIVEDTVVTTPSSLPRSSSLSSFMSGKRRVEQFGFMVRTSDKLLELASESKAEANTWMESFREAMAMAMSSIAGNKHDFDDATNIAEASTRASTAQTVQTSSSNNSTLTAATSSSPKRRQSFTQMFRRGSSRASSQKSSKIVVSTASQEFEEGLEEEDPFMRSLGSNEWTSFMGQSQIHGLRSGALASEGDDPTPSFGLTNSSFNSENVNYDCTVNSSNEKPSRPMPASFGFTRSSLNSEIVNCERAFDAIDEEPSQPVTTTFGPIEKDSPQSKNGSLSPRQQSVELLKQPVVMDSAITCWNRTEKKDHVADVAQRYRDKGEGLSISQRLAKIEFSDDEDSDDDWSTKADFMLAKSIEKARLNAIEYDRPTRDTTVVDKVSEIHIIADCAGR